MFGELISQLQKSNMTSYSKYEKVCPTCKKLYKTDARQQIYCTEKCRIASKTKSAPAKVLDEVIALLSDKAMTRPQIVKAINASKRAVDDCISGNRKHFYISGYAIVRGKYVPEFRTRKGKNERDVTPIVYARIAGRNFTEKVAVCFTDDQYKKLNKAKGKLTQQDYIRKVLEESWAK